MKNISISNFIRTKYKDYALYVLNSRGIPNFYDCLTPVQRIILLNAPKKFEKTLSTVGNCMKAGYHHGDSSLEKSINRLAKTYNCSLNLLEGDGFFGTAINDVASACRYTSVRINKQIDEFINELSFLNTKNDDNIPNPLNVRIPIGLLLPVIGIAIGYRTLILPRKLKDIQDFLQDKRKSCKPYFQNFSGTIKQLENKSWLFEGEVKVLENEKTIVITSLPPMMKYQSFINKINHILDDINYEILNLSKDNINLTITIKSEWWETLRDSILKATKMIVKEGIVLIKDKKVLEYDSIEDYLLDFKNKNLLLEAEKKQYDLKIYNNEYEYLIAKREFFNFMLGKKRENKEIVDFIKTYKSNISNRLENIKLIKLNKDELVNINNKIITYDNLIKELKIEINKYNKFIDNISFELHNKKSIRQQFFEDDEQEVEIEYYDPFEELEEEN